MKQVFIASALFASASAFGQHAPAAHHEAPPPLAPAPVAAAAHSMHARTVTADTMKGASKFRAAPMEAMSGPTRGAFMEAMSGPTISWAEDNPATYGGGDSSTYGGGGGGVYCPSGRQWGGPGLYCLSDNLYNCDNVGYPATMYQNCNTDCVTAPAGQPDYCRNDWTRPPTPRRYPTPRPPTPRPRAPTPRPAGETRCDYRYNCNDCMNLYGCNWDPNWNVCRSPNECDYTYRPSEVGYSMSPEDNPNMNTACYVQPSQCYTGDDGIIDNNPWADSCNRVDNCHDCTRYDNDCVFDTYVNLCMTRTAQRCRAPFCLDYSTRNQCNSGR